MKANKLISEIWLPSVKFEKCPSINDDRDQSQSSVWRAVIGRCHRFFLFRVSCCCVIDVMLLHCVCCTRFIQTRIIVSSVSLNLILSEFDIPGMFINLCVKYQDEERPDLRGVSCWPRLLCGMTFPALCLTPELQMC